MPPSLLFDISGLDLDAVLFNRAAVDELNPQRGDMCHLDGILHADAERGRMVGFKDVRADEFWVPGHIPGRPLFPGVLMIEAAAQMASFYTLKYEDLSGFIGFSGVEECKFRVPVMPGVRLLLLLQKLYVRRRRVSAEVQGLVNGQIAFQLKLNGTAM